MCIFSDGAKNEDTTSKVEQVIAYLKTVDGFESVTIFESNRNKGLANSIIDGVTTILESNESIIVLEDDLITSSNFLGFMNQALAFYENDENIFSISGFTLDLPSLPGTNDYYFGYRASSWGWGIWKSRWTVIDWNVEDYSSFIKDKESRKRFNRGGSDMSKMLKNQMEGCIDSWAIRFCYYQFSSELKTVFPTVSKVKSIGFGNDATHTSGTTRFFSKLDKENKQVFKFDLYQGMDNQLVTEFASKFSIYSRLKDKIKQFF